MFVIVTESVPDRLRGYLSRWLLEVRAGVFVGAYSVKVRERLWGVVVKECVGGNAVVVWTAQNEAGFDFDTVGSNARMPIELDGVKLVGYRYRTDMKKECLAVGKFFSAEKDQI